jgi:hypothetical protein
MGAMGCVAAARFLTKKHGHRIVELERYAMANKLWTTKIKRLRVPDLLCLDCGLRVEARAKSDLKIRLSESESEGREWDAGLRDEDAVAFMRWDSASQQTADHVECFHVGPLRESFGVSKLGSRKSASEGAEVDRTWPATVPKRSGTVENVDPETGRATVLLDAADGQKPRKQSYWLRDDNASTHFYVQEGERIRGGEQFLLGCVERAESFDCQGKGWDHGGDLNSEDKTSRYIAVKVAGLTADASQESELLRLAKDDDDVRIRLEAAASLARIDPDRYVRGLLAYASPETAESETRPWAMEAVFILSELPTDEAASALMAIAADRDRDSELRCAAVWGLGVAGHNRPEAVLPYIADEDDEVALHAIAGIGDVPPALLAEVTSRLKGNDREAASAAALLSYQGEDGARALVDAASGEGGSAAWARSALGEMPQELVQKAAGESLSGNTREAVKPMWLSGTSWLRRFEADSPLRFMRRQTLRLKP